MFESIWDSYQTAANSINSDAIRLMNSGSPEYSSVDPVIEYYDIELNILKARPIYLDPTRRDANYTIIPISVFESTPIRIGRESVRRDMFVLGKNDYNSIKDLVIGNYLVVGDKYFRVLSMKSKDETGDNYFDGYAVEIDGSLSYIKDRVTIYFTTGRAFKVDDYVLNITNIGDLENFKFNSGYIEFDDDVIANGIENGSILYSKDVEVMENNLYNNFQALVDIDWQRYRYDNYSGKASINVLLKSLQSSGRKDDYEKALNIYYGLPVAPDDAEVIGLFESYDYRVLSVAGSTITLDSFHGFIQIGSRFIVNNTIGIVTALNRDDESIELDIPVEVDDVLNIQLNNRMDLTGFYKNYYTNTEVRCDHWTDGGDIQHIIDVSQKLPTIILYNHATETDVYHMKSVEAGLKISIDDRASTYNDFIDIDYNDEVSIVGAGYIHIQWPTSKYLLLKMGDIYYKAYMDAPIDTLLDSGDKVKKYDVLCRCVSAINHNVFTGWDEFFTKNNGFDLESNILELVDTIPGVKFGSYFPQEKAIF